MKTSVIPKEFKICSVVITKKGKYICFVPLAVKHFSTENFEDHIRRKQIQEYEVLLLNQMARGVPFSGLIFHSVSEHCFVKT